MIDSCVTVRTISIRFSGFKNNNYFIKLAQLKDITGDANGSKYKIYSLVNFLKPNLSKLTLNFGSFSLCCHVSCDRHGL